MPLLQTSVEPPPFRSDLIGGPENPAMSGPWQDWLLLALLPRLQASAPTITTVNLPANLAALGLTVLLPAAQAGRYRITLYARVTTAASVNSSITPTITAVDGTVTTTQTGAALTSNLTTQPGSWTFEVRSDAGSPISLSVAYVSNAAGMIYDLVATVEQL